MNELVSVIIPIYNAEKCLRKCLNSIVSQTYKNLEIILINDGSTDDSGSICIEYSDKDSRIHYINKQNEGQSVTRNMGIDIANGKYLYFMDSDDYVDQSFIENALGVITKNNADTAVFNYYHVYDNKNNVEERAFAAGNYDLSKAHDRYKFLTKVFLPYKCGFEVWNRLYSADIIKDNQLKFPVFKPVVGEDICFNLLYLLCAKKICISNERYYYYYHNPGSTMDINNGIIQLDRYNEISKIGYGFVEKRETLKYIKENYSYIHILLIYHELMNFTLNDSKKLLGTICDKNYFKNVIRITPKHIFNATRAIGFIRGIKYALYGVVYKLFASGGY